MHFLYILYSISINKYYVGETPDVSIRIKQHNLHYFSKSLTKAASDWKVALSLECASKEEAVYLEKFVKKMKSRHFIEKVIANHEILTDILKKR